MRELKKQARIVGALVMRELITRYGREGLASCGLFLSPSFSASESWVCGPS